MCGIAGVMYRDPQRPVETRVLQQMGEAIAHRGPDGSGRWTELGVGLVHRRLSIVDVDGGAQPQANEDGTVQVVFNGEIYNFAALRDELQARGHRFRTHSDTEVLVHLYEEAGERLVEQLRGMFAFAIWDSRRRRLLLARDRIGLKPLYLYRDEEKLLFGSEIKALLAHPEVDRSLDLHAVEDYLTFGIISGDHSIFRQVRKLPPAHVVTIAPAQWNASPRRYWQLRIAADHNRSVCEWQSAVRAKLTETVRAHRMADVPVGAFLSGGLDSSAVVATLASLGGPPVQTFSVGFQEAAYSELPHARAVARKWGTTHTEEIVRPQAVASLRNLIHFYDEPFADPSAVATLEVARVAAERVKVVLSGDGGDEAFGGYGRYVHDCREARVRRYLPRWFRHGILGPLGSVWPKADWLPRLLRAKTTLTNLALDDATAYANTLSVCRPPLRRQLLLADVRRQLTGPAPEEWVKRAYASAPSHDPLGAMIAADVGMLLPDAFLTKVDRASMAYGLEVRPPLVDHEFLELAATIPAHLKIHRGEGKWIFKQAVKDQLPVETLRRPKQGFDIPIDEWLRGPLRESFEASVLESSSGIASLLNQDLVARLFAAHRSRIGRHGNLLWALLVLASWLEHYLIPTGQRSSNAPEGQELLAGTTIQER
jgi:asparagine synthase (glutamine-hydrolysing)